MEKLTAPPCPLQSCKADWAAIGRGLTSPLPSWRAGQAGKAQNTAPSMQQPPNGIPVPPAGEKGSPEGLAPLALPAQGRGLGQSPKNGAVRKKNGTRRCRFGV